LPLILIKKLLVTPSIVFKAGLKGFNMDFCTMFGSFNFLHYMEILMMKLKEVPSYICFLIGNSMIYMLKVAERLLNPLGIKIV